MPFPLSAVKEGEEEGGDFTVTSDVLGVGPKAKRLLNGVRELIGSAQQRLRQGRAVAALLSAVRTGVLRVVCILTPTSRTHALPKAEYAFQSRLYLLLSCAWVMLLPVLHEVLLTGHNAQVTRWRCLTHCHSRIQLSCWRGHRQLMAIRSVHVVSMNSVLGRQGTSQGTSGNACCGHV